MVSMLNGVSVSSTTTLNCHKDVEEPDDMLAFKTDRKAGSNESESRQLQKRKGGADGFAAGASRAPVMYVCADT